MTTTERIDLDDDEAFAAFHDIYRRALDRDVDQPYSAREKRVGMRPDEYVDKVVLLARDGDGTPVAAGTAELPLRDNTRFVYVDVFTLPEQRRRGHGAAVVEALEEIGRDADRSLLYGEAVWELDAVDPASQAFSEAVGFRLDLMDAMRVLTLPATLPPLEVATGYTIHSWRGACPEEWAQGLRRRPAADQRGGSRRRRGAGERVLGRRACSRGGGAVGRAGPHTTGEHRGERRRRGRGSHPAAVPGRQRRGVPMGHPRAADPPGHGLGLALKVTTMQEAVDLLDGRRRITTYNAAGNEPMIRVNEALGFRQTAWVGEYVKEL